MRRAMQTIFICESDTSREKEADRPYRMSLDMSNGVYHSVVPFYCVPLSGASVGKLILSPADSWAATAAPPFLIDFESQIPRLIGFIALDDRKPDVIGTDSLIAGTAVFNSGSMADSHLVIGLSCPDAFGRIMTLSGGAGL